MIQIDSIPTGGDLGLHGPRRRTTRLLRATAAALALTLLWGCAETEAASRKQHAARSANAGANTSGNASAARPKPANAAAATAAASAAVTNDYSKRDDVRAFVADVAQRNQLDEAAVLRSLAGVRFDASVIKLMTPPPSTARKSWSQYRGRFLDAQRVREGVRFWQTYGDDVKRASQQYGVPEEIIVGIMGVETFYGRIAGNYRVLDALTVLAFDYPRRADYFKGELEQFLIYTRDDGIAPETVLGSFAGAIGLPQFMPTSIRRYAVDFDGNGHIDLRNSPVDAIGSVARFLAEHGWRRGEPVRFRAMYQDEAQLAPLLEAGIEPQTPIAQMAKYGVASPDVIPDDMKLALIDLPDGDGPTVYYLGAPNFYVITRYNRSSFYAMSVYELGQALRDAMGDTGSPATGSDAGLRKGNAVPQRTAAAN